MVANWEIELINKYTVSNVAKYTVGYTPWPMLIYKTALSYVYDNETSLIIAGEHQAARNKSYFVSGILVYMN